MKMKKRELNNKKIKPNIKIIIFVIVIISFLILSITLAKYAFKVEDIHQIESSAFYFNSDIIGNYETEEWNGENNLEINFTVKNYENNNLITNENITYNIEVEKLDDTNNEILAKIYENNVESLGDQVLTGNAVNSKNYVLKISKNKDITATEFNLKIKINSLTPYKQELIGNIKINLLKNNNEINTTIEDKGEYVALKISTNDFIDNKTIIFDNTKLTLDKANILLSNIEATTNGNTSSFTIPKSNFETNMDYEINFIKIDNSSEIELGRDIGIN